MAEMRPSKKGFVVQDEEAGITPMTVVPASLFDQGQLHVKQTTAGIELCWRKDDGRGDGTVLLAYRADQGDRAASAARVLTDRVNIYQTWSPTWDKEKGRMPSLASMGIGVIAVGVAVGVTVFLAAFAGRELLIANRGLPAGPVVGANLPVVEWPQAPQTIQGTPGGKPAAPVQQPAPVVRQQTGMPSAEQMQQNQAFAMQKIEAAVEKVRQEQYGQAGQGAPAAAPGGGPVRTGEFVTIAE